MVFYAVYYDGGEIRYFKNKEDAYQQLWMIYMILFGRKEDPVLQNLTRKKLNEFHMIDSVGFIKTAIMN